MKLDDKGNRINYYADIPQSVQYIRCLSNGYCPYIIDHI